MVQNGPGTTVLRNAGNSYTGGTFVQSGTLVMENPRRCWATARCW